VSMSQFDKWLRERGVEQRNGRYYVSCAASAAPSSASLAVTISSRARDRHGDVIEPSGADTSAFRANPIVLWAHKLDELPVGRVERIALQDERLVADVVFDSRPFAREVERLYREGFLNGWSVGFLPRKWDALKNGEGRFDGYHITEWELIELSAVPVPANPEALTREMAEGAIRAPSLRKTLGEVLGIPAERPVVDASSGTGAASPPTACPAPTAPPEAVAALAQTLFPLFWPKLREWALDAAAREIRRRQGRLD
jgi:HK97 family phage prohead protease